MGVTFHDRALSIGDVLVVADLHFGKGAASTVEFPLGAGEDAVERLERLLEAVDPATVVLAGDVFHSFEYVPQAAERALAAVVAAVRDGGASLVVIEGNHDTMLESVYDGQLRDHYRIDVDGLATVVCHGHREPAASADRYVIGHDHPAIVIEGQKRPCFLVGEAEGAAQGADLIVVPAFNRLVEGVSVNGRLGVARPELSPMISNIGAFRPVIYDGDSGEVLRFPPLASFERML